MNDFYVYLHKRASDNKVFYVGKGRGNRLTWVHSRSGWWNNVVSKHGFIAEIVFDNLDEETAFQVEKDTILEHRYFGSPLVNLTTGGDGRAGYKPNLEQRKRMSEAQKKSEASAASRLASAAKRRGLPLKEGVGSKIGDALRGVPKSESHKLKAQEAKRCKTIYQFYNIETNELFTGTRYDFSEASGHSRLRVSSLFGSRPTLTMFGWSLVTDDI